jgi:exopolysaccharide biosynthesis WecB/TagA/CpsF family protein
MPPPANAISFEAPSAPRPTTPTPTPTRFGDFVITETGSFPPPAGAACWVYVPLNAEVSLSLPHNGGLRQLLAQARLRISVDGQWLWWALRRKYPERPLAKLSGSDLIYDIARHCAAHGRRLMLLGSQTPINTAAAQTLRRCAPGLDVVAVTPRFFAAGSAAETQAHAEALAAIEAKRPDYVVLGLGVEKEHRLAAALAPRLDGRVTGFLCFGGAIDFAGGAFKRAPLGWQQAGAEGLYRVWQDPSRLRRLLRVLRILPRLAAGRY